MRQGSVRQGENRPGRAHVATPDRVAAALRARTGARILVDQGSVIEIIAAAPPRRPLLEGAALIVFTSGSTGEPKGVVIDHGRFAAKIQILAHLLGIDANDTVLVPLQLTFIFGIWASVLSVAVGARLVLMPKFAPAAAAAFLADRASVMFSFPEQNRNGSWDKSTAQFHIVRSKLLGRDKLGCKNGGKTSGIEEVEVRSLQEMPRHYPKRPGKRDRCNIRHRDKHRRPADPLQLTNDLVQRVKMLDHLRDDNAVERIGFIGKRWCAVVEPDERGGTRLQMIANNGTIDLDPRNLTTAGAKLKQQITVAAAEIEDGDAEQRSRKRFDDRAGVLRWPRAIDVIPMPHLGCGVQVMSLSACSRWRSNFPIHRSPISWIGIGLR